MSLNLGAHFLSVKDLYSSQIVELLKRTQQFISPTEELLTQKDRLMGKTVVNLFFENSTRTRCSFELAAKRLGAHTLNFDAKTSATQKGETLFDTVDYLRAMSVNLFIIRHEQEGAPASVAAHLGSQGASVINAGDGCHEHPTQAILDLFTIQRYKTSFDQLKIAIVGDIVHSRVARSDIIALCKLGVREISLVGPPALLPPTPPVPGITHLTQNLLEGLDQADVVIALRIQRERMQEAALPNADDYFQKYGITQQALTHAKPDAIVMHPGPMNRGVEIASDVADGKQSVIFKQAQYGVAVRMAIISSLLDN